MTSEGVGVVDFQLYLLKVMDPPASLLDSSLKKLNRTEAQMVDRYEVVSRLMQWIATPGGNVKEILKEVLVDAGGRQHVYHLPVWPDFKFSIFFDESGRYVERMEFEGGGDCGDVEIAPWRFLEVHLGENFDQVRMIDGWGHYRSYVVRDSDGEEFFLRFAWGLLQEVSVVR